MTRIAEAISAHRRGDFARAERLYRQLIRKKRDLSQAKHMLGVLRYQNGHFDEAERLIRQALAISEDDAAHYHHGMVLSELDRYQEAVASFDKAIALNPSYAGAYNNRGVALQAMKRYEDALASFDKAIALNPGFAEALYNRGNAIDAMVLLGNELFAQNRDDEALTLYDKAIFLRPEHAEARFAKALLKLSLGDYAEGWRLYEWRWRTRSFAPFLRNYGPLWQGDDDLSGKTIFIHADQGMGDAIHLSRYLPMLRARNCRVLFEVHGPLVPLFHDYDIEVIARGEAPPSAEALPPFDFHCPLFSLPLVFKTTLDTIPSSVPYLTAQRDKVDAWGALLGEKTRPRVGLTWSGNPKLRHDFRRSINLETLTPILTDAVEWFSLQPNVRDHDRETLAATPALRDLTDRLTDFSDTAALISHMDAVISVDTSVAHVAGALGKPLWLLLPFHPDFRWLRERSDSPWYPTATLFRQTRDGDWSDVLARVAWRLLEPDMLSGEHYREASELR
jgi:Flp pilus assembly protein TadD